MSSLYVPPENPCLATLTTILNPHAPIEDQITSTLTDLISACKSRLRAAQAVRQIKVCILREQFLEKRKVTETTRKITLEPVVTRKAFKAKNNVTNAPLDKKKAIREESTGVTCIHPSKEEIKTHKSANQTNFEMLEHTIPTNIRRILQQDEHECQDKEQNGRLDLEALTKQNKKIILQKDSKTRKVVIIESKKGFFRHNERPKNEYALDENTIGIKELKKRNNRTIVRKGKKNEIRKKKSAKPERSKGNVENEFNSNLNIEICESQLELSKKRRNHDKRTIDLEQVHVFSLKKQGCNETKLCENIKLQARRAYRHTQGKGEFIGDGLERRKKQSLLCTKSYSRSRKSKRINEQLEFGDKKVDRYKNARNKSTTSHMNIFSSQNENASAKIAKSSEFKKLNDGSGKFRKASNIFAFRGNDAIPIMQKKVKQPYYPKTKQKAKVDKRCQDEPSMVKLDIFSSKTWCE